ncbi:hypothetical protein LTR36_005409 [Oleoguttula mirabilis]|uniref:Cytochrome P450 n=1 Tax=Oleoguttula mirabilis TaxID=1507867 RepID=A0AAV9JFB0_9PEZI|nr:hypothetical protein LTR36_005409 [Oleoguttula mirabilis]
MDTATDFLFGESTGTLRQAASEHDFAEAFHYAQKAVIVRGTLGPLNVFYRDRKAEACNRICRGLTQNYVDKAFQALESKHVDDKQDQPEPRRQKHIFSHELAARTSDRKRVLDELMNVLLAGRDTTASLLSNLFFMLAKDTEIWTKLRSEVATLEGQVPSYEQINTLKYVQCCINESDGASPVFVTKGTLVCYNVYALHRRKDFYGSDADDFRPERWEDGKLQQRLRWAYLPFNGGPRICLGQRYALTEVAYVLVRMVQEFRALRSEDPRPWEELLSLTLRPRNGVKVSLTPA